MSEKGFPDYSGFIRFLISCPKKKINFLFLFFVKNLYFFLLFWVFLRNLGSKILSQFSKIPKVNEPETPFSIYSNKHLAMQTFAEFYVLKKRKDPLDQLCNGLENLGILSLIRGYPSLMKPYFVAHELPSLTSKDILDSFSYRMVSEPDDERSVRADRFMQQAVLKLEEGTVTKTFNNT